MGDQDIGRCCHAIGKNGRALGGADAGHIIQILDGHGKACEQAAFGHGFFHEIAGMGAGPVKTQGGQGIYLAVHGGNAALQRIEAIQRGDIAAFQTRYGFHWRWT